MWTGRCWTWSTTSAGSGANGLGGTIWTQTGCTARPCHAGAGALLGRLGTRDWALVTSNYERQVRARADRAGLPVPAVIVDADAVIRGKPEPEGYRLAARRLAIAWEHCLVIEDGATGIQAGRAAGMTVWAVNAEPGAAAAAGAQRTFATLAGAAEAILAWTRG